MKRFLATLSLVTLLSQFYSGCSKIDGRCFTDCDVQQCPGYWSPGITGEPANFIPPYLFRKTYDANGRTKTIDAYIYSLGFGFHIKSNLELKGQILYCLNANKANDTLMTVWLNTKGRPVKAQGITSLPVSQQYAFSYDNKNRLQYIFRSNPNGIDTCRYDTYGNILTTRNDAYEYDYSRKAKQQFYYDFENWSTFFYGFHFLNYLNFFPELTSPVHVRIRHHAIYLGPNSYEVNIDLTNHQFDSQGKLIWYGQLSKPDNYIIWNCDHANSIGY